MTLYCYYYNTICDYKEYGLYFQNNTNISTKEEDRIYLALLSNIQTKFVNNAHFLGSRK